MAFLAAIKGLRDKDKAKEKAWDLAEFPSFRPALAEFHRIVSLRPDGRRPRNPAPVAVRAFARRSFFVWEKGLVHT